MVIPASNRSMDPNTYYPLRSELPTVWLVISNAIQGLKDFKEHSTTRVVLDDVLGLELYNFAMLLKLRPRVNDDHVLVQQMADDLWFRQKNYERNAQENMVRRNLTSSEEDLMALALRTKPHINALLSVSPRVCTLGDDAFEHAPAVIEEIHAHLENLMNEREQAGGMMFQLMQDVNTLSPDNFLATRAKYESSDALLGGMGVG